MADDTENMDSQDSDAPVRPDEIVAAVAAAIAGRAFTRGMLRPVITSDLIAAVVSEPAFAQTISADTLTQTLAFLESGTSDTVIENAKAVAAHMLRARLNARIGKRPVKPPQPVGGQHGPRGGTEGRALE